MAQRRWRKTINGRLHHEYYWAPHLELEEAVKRTSRERVEKARFGR